MRIRGAEQFPLFVMRSVFCKGRRMRRERMNFDEAKKGRWKSFFIFMRGNSCYVRKKLYLCKFKKSYLT